MKQSLEDKSLMTARHNKRKWNGRSTYSEGPSHQHLNISTSKLQPEPKGDVTQNEVNDTSLNTTSNPLSSGNYIFF